MKKRAIFDASIKKRHGDSVKGLMPSEQREADPEFIPYEDDEEEDFSFEMVDTSGKQIPEKSTDISQDSDDKTKETGSSTCC